MKKYIIILLAILSINIKAQISYPAPNYYGFGPCSGSAIVPTTVINSTSSIRYYGLDYFKNLVITKKQTTGYNIPLKFNEFSSISQNNCLSNKFVYLETNHSNLDYTTNTTYGFTDCDGFNTSGSSASVYSVPAGDQSYVINSYNNTISVTYNASTNQKIPFSSWGVISELPINSINSGTWKSIRLKRSVENNIQIKLWDFQYVPGHTVTGSGTVYQGHYSALKYNKTANLIVSDPKNWTYFSCTDYDGTPSLPSNASSKTTRYAFLRNYSSGTFDPQILLGNMPHTSIWDSIYKVEIHYNNIGGGTSWNTLGGGADYKAGVPHSTLPSGKWLVFRYFYKLADDPATTTGIKFGFLDVNALIGNASVGNSSGNSWGTPSNPFTVCRNTPTSGNIYSLNWWLVNQSAAAYTHINLPYSDLYAASNYSYTMNYCSSTGNFNVASAPNGIYSGNCRINYDNGFEDFSVSVHIADTPLVFNSTYFKYGDGSIVGSVASELKMCQSDISYDNTTIENMFFNTNASAYFGITGNNTMFTWGVRQGSKSGAYVTSSLLGNPVNNKTAKATFSQLAPGDYFIEFFDPGAQFNNTTNTLCNPASYFFKLVVVPNTKPNLGIDKTWCKTDGTYQIPYTPLGGTFSSNIVTGLNTTTGQFSPNSSSTPLGQSIIYYQISTTTGTMTCIGKDTLIMTVNSNPKPNLGGSQSFCSNSPSYTIPNTPTGGTFNSVTGLSGNVFSPSVAGIGTKTITYQVVNGSCLNSDTITMSIFSSPPNIVLSKDTIFTCDNYGLTDLTTNVVSPAGVNWSGNGINGNKFNPTSVAINNIYMGIGTLSIGTCSSTDTVFILNRQGINLSNFTGNSICHRDSNYNLNSLIVSSDKGGKHYSPLYPTRILNDSILSTGNSTGTNNLKYYKIAGNGCSDTIDYTMIVNTNPSAPSYIKNYDSVCTIQGNPTSNITLKSYYGITVASGINESWSGVGQSGGVANIHSLTPGQIYNYMFLQTDNNGCKDTSVFQLKSNNGSNNVLLLTRTYDTICHSSSVESLQKYNLNLRSGAWSYSVMPSAIQNNSDLATQFLPLNTISTMNYTADTNGCLVTKSLNLFRFKPSVNAGNDKNLCSNGSPQILFGTPTGGVWSIDTVGTYVSVFNPSSLSITQSNQAKQYNLYYNITSNGCEAYDTAVYTIIKKPNATFVKNTDSVCINQGTMDLTTHYGVNPIGGVWTGLNLNNNILSLTAAGSGTKTHKYIIQNQYGCLDTTTYNTRIDDVNNTGIIDTTDFKVCEASNPIKLNQFKLIGSIGTWSGNSIIDTMFYPTITGTGIFNVKFATTNKSCAISLNKKLWVVAKPTTPEITGSLKYCLGNTYNLSVKDNDPLLNYKWMIDNITSNGTTKAGTIITNLNVELVAYNYLNCPSFTKTVKLELDTPSGSINADKNNINNADEVAFTIDKPTNIVSSFWDFKDGSDKFNKLGINHFFYNSSTISDASYNVECILTSATGCKKTISKQIVVVKRIKQTTGIEDAISSITIYPNPTTEYIIIKDDKFKRGEVAELYDMTGRLIKSFQVTSDEFRIDLDYSAGHYILKYKGEINKLQIIK